MLARFVFAFALTAAAAPLVACNDDLQGPSHPAIFQDVGTDTGETGPNDGSTGG
jgi:hypothetical protein